MPYFKTENGNAENIKYDNTKSVKEAIDDIKDTAMFIDSFDTDTGTLNTTSVSSSSSSDPTASSVTFDNANTGLNATNVQDAVTEVNGKLIVPDYGSAVEITLPYTADNNGYIVVANMKSVSLKIGTMIVYTNGTVSTTYASRGIIPIAKGDTLSLAEGEPFKLHFLPAK